VILAAVGGVVIVSAATLIALFVVHEDPGARPMGEAVEEFRESGPATPERTAGRRPPAGVYAAFGEGREELSFPPLSQHDGDVMPISVIHTSDTCWSFIIDFNAAHRQSWDYCSDEQTGTIAERGGQTDQRWDLGAATISTSTTFVCDPPALVLAVDATADQTWDHSCEGTNTEVPGTTRSAGSYRFVGVEHLEIDGVDVSAHHYSQVRELSGAQTGEQTTEVWIEVETGLPLRAERTVRVDSSSPVGDITYTEEGWWQLQSRVPAQ
jgi:hypothetical protein